jgi:DNA polymerase-3 subunit epsilon
MKPTLEELKEFKEKAKTWAAERLTDPNTVICDTETTGLITKDNDTEICQLALTDTKGRPLFSMLLKPFQPMSEEVVNIHNITNKQVFNQPMFPQVAKIIEFVLTGKHIVCWNADFDIRLLWHMFKKYDQKLPEIAGASCAMDRYSEWCGEWNTKRDGFKWQRLPALSGLSSHDAYSDCLSTIKVMEKMSGSFDPLAVEADTISLDF